MSDLDAKEQQHVRAALHYLRIQMGGLKPLAKALSANDKTLRRVASGENGVSASTALRVARLLDVPFDDLLLGRYQPGACSKCGHRPHYMPVYASDFKDENTVVEDAPRQANASLSVVK
jgi:transcriptional regulator with XRE-family HTH domain